MPVAPSPFLTGLAARLVLLWLLVAVAGFAALALGAQDYPAGMVWRALTSQALSGGDDPALAILREMRLPRAGAAVLVGAALAVAGLMMQALTRNPLADPGLTGVNAGAALAVVAGLWWAGPLAPAALAGLALAGAAAAAALVRALAGTGDTTLRLPLAGAAFASLCMAIVALVVLLNPEARGVYRFWMVGSLSMADAAMLARMAPLAVFGLGLALLMARQIEALGLGAELAGALGVHPARAAAGALLAITCLAGASVALAGPVGFVGLIAPHLARRALPKAAGLAAQVLAAAPLGAFLTLLADLAGRRLPRPAELPLGIVLTLIGAPVFMMLVRRMLRAGAA